MNTLTLFSIIYVIGITLLTLLKTVIQILLLRKTSISNDMEVFLNAALIFL